MNHEHTLDHNICFILTAYSGRRGALLHMEDLKSMPSPEPLASFKPSRAFAPSSLFPSPSLQQTVSQDTVIASDPVQRICTKWPLMT
jgi:hypothetical protein